MGKQENIQLDIKAKHYAISDFKNIDNNDQPTIFKSDTTAIYT